MKISGKQIAEALGVLAIVASLLFVVYEMRLARSIAQTEGFNEIHELTRSMNELIASNAEIWGRGCMSEELSADEAIVFARIADSKIHFDWTRWSRARIGISDAPTSIGVESLARNMYEFPGIKAAWDKGIVRGSPVFQASVNDEYQSLVKSGAERNQDISFCGR